MQTFIRTHSGFVWPKAEELEAKIQYYGNPKLDELYADLINKPQLIKTWAWRSEAIKTITSLFSQSPSFFKLQLNSGLSMSPRCIDFLHSTLTFILTGKRKLSVVLWDDLLEFHPTDLAKVSDVTQDHFTSTFGALLVYPLYKVIAQWLSQPGGLEDMVVTAYLLFGRLPENWNEV